MTEFLSQKNWTRNGPSNYDVCPPAFSSTASTPSPSLTLTKVCGKEKGSRLKTSTSRRDILVLMSVWVFEQKLYFPTQKTIFVTSLIHLFRSFRSVAVSWICGKRTETFCSPTQTFLALRQYNVIAHTGILWLFLILIYWCICVAFITCSLVFVKILNHGKKDKITSLSSVAAVQSTWGS